MSSSSPHDAGPLTLADLMSDSDRAAPIEITVTSSNFKQVLSNFTESHSPIEIRIFGIGKLNLGYSGSYMLTGNSLNSQTLALFSGARNHFRSPENLPSNTIIFKNTDQLKEFMEVLIGFGSSSSGTGRGIKKSKKSRKSRKSRKGRKSRKSRK